jgi:hypothetical protein
MVADTAFKGGAEETSISSRLACRGRVVMSALDE